MNTERKSKISCNKTRGNVWNYQLAGLQNSKREQFSAHLPAELTAIHTLSYQKHKRLKKSSKNLWKRPRTAFHSALLDNMWRLRCTGFFLWPSDGIHADSVQHPARDMVALALHSQKWYEFEWAEICTVFLVRYAKCSFCTLFPILFIIRF